MEADELNKDPRFHEITGNLVFPGFTAPKLVWVKKHEPEVFEKVAKVHYQQAVIIEKSRNHELFRIFL